jgi:hypothetical protein
MMSSLMTARQAAVDHTRACCGQGFRITTCWSRLPAKSAPSLNAADSFYALKQLCQEKPWNSLTLSRIHLKKNPQLHRSHRFSATPSSDTFAFIWFANLKQSGAILDLPRLAAG